MGRVRADVGTRRTRRAAPGAPVLLVLLLALAGVSVTAGAVGAPPAGNVGDVAPDFGTPAPTASPAVPGTGRPTPGRRPAHEVPAGPATAPGPVPVGAPAGTAPGAPSGTQPGTAPGAPSGTAPGTSAGRPPGAAPGTPSGTPTSTPATPTARPNRPAIRYVDGAAGAGDSYFPDAGNGGYQVRHYSLDLSYDPVTLRLEGTAVLDAVATANLARFDLDLREPLQVRSVQVDGLPASVRRTGQELVVTPRVRPRSGWAFTVTVRYGGTPRPVTDPDGSLDGWIPTDDGAFVAAEPQGAPTWFPCSDHPGDKATFTVSMTVPDGITAVGNGELVRQRSAGGRTTFVWDSQRPMASYLATITLGRFAVTRTVLRSAASAVAQPANGSGIPVYLAVDPREAVGARPALARFADVLDFEQSVFGRYPFDSAGVIVDDAHFVGYALETQTRPVFDRAPTVRTLVHELAHQWYGDSVSLTRWRDIWLNEALATYAEWLWSEHDGGRTTRELFDRYYATPATDSGMWNPPPTDPGASHLFGDSVYLRGAMMLQALRDRIGDVAFFRLLRDWASEHRYGNATSAEFTALAERDSGHELGPFFDAWLSRPGKPTRW